MGQVFYRRYERYAMEVTPKPCFSFPTFSNSSMADELLRWILPTLDDTQASFRILKRRMAITLENINFW
jgi:hypothetical protein